MIADGEVVQTRKGNGEAGGNGKAVRYGTLERRRQEKLEKRSMRSFLKARGRELEGQEEDNMDGKLKFLKRRKGEG